MEIPEEPGEALADRYELRRELGRGGMATVHLARDLRHERDVAVKLIRADVSAVVGSDRFLREIRITARLNHPHVLPLLDSGEAGDRLFYVMPYMAGGSLRRRLEERAPLPPEEAVAVAGEVASALEHAHRHDVVHRDVKPENILFSDDHAVVADFGIARALSEAGGRSLTRTGFPLGTPGYMSPEQAAGTLDVDGRADVYGLAAVVYEMLVGDVPGMWPTDEALRLGRFVDAPAEHRVPLDRLPGRLQQLLVRGLALRPEDRVPSPGDFAAALEAAATGTGKVTDARVDAILDRAVRRELEAGEEAEEGALSLGGVEQIAAEAGISPEHVRAAARELARTTPGAPEGPATDVGPPVGTGRLGKLFDPTEERGKGDRVEVERTVPGELPEEAFLDAVEVIQEAVGTVGHASTLGRSLTWSPAGSAGGERNVVVTVTPHGGETRIRVEERFQIEGVRAQLLFGFSSGGTALLAMAIVGGLVGQTPLLLLAGLAGAAGGGYMGYHGALGYLRTDRAPGLEALAERLGELVEERTGGRLPGGGEGGEGADGEGRRLPP